MTHDPAAAADDDLAADYRALREGVALCDYPGELRLLTGPDRQTFLHRMCTQDLRPLKPGGGAYACACTNKGMVVADFHVSARTADLALVCGPGAGEALIAYLERYHITEDLAFAPPAPETALLGLIGPEAGAALISLVGVELFGGAPFAHTEGHWNGAGFWAARCDLGTVPAALLSLPADAARVAREVLAAGGARPAGAAALEVLRIEEALPCRGRDYDDKTLVQELRLETRAVSFSKGCYVGQEVVARIQSRGHVNRRWSLMSAAAAAPAAGTSLYDGEREVGAMSSAAPDPRRPGHALAVGLLRRGHDAPGTALALGAPDGPAVTVRPIPWLAATDAGG